LGDMILKRVPWQAKKKNKADKSTLYKK